MVFDHKEFSARLVRVKASMESHQVNLMVVSDPNNIYWLTGAADWSFYVPQIVVVSQDDDQPVWIGRPMDVVGAQNTGWMDNDNFLSYPESYIHRPGIHASDYMGQIIADRWPAARRIGYESDSYYFSIKSFTHLQKALPNRKFIDCELLVNWARCVKSKAELGYMRQAARIVEAAMATAYETIRPGVRQCDAVAEIYKTQMAPNAEFGGDVTALCPIILAGENAATAHPMWNDTCFEKDQIVAIELGGARKHYTCALARTMFLGTCPPDNLLDTAKAVEEGLEAVLGTLKSGVSGHEAHGAWEKVLKQYGLSKESRIGYAIGIGLPPDWGEHTISLRAGDHAPIEPNTCIHVMLGMWMEGWGMEMSETVRVTETGVECLTNFPRGVKII